jgi:2-polyprenyl-3-methyl-5-hydroxy-6-metoxy-1,4-benzoquinol methylase
MKQLQEVVRGATKKETGIMRPAVYTWDNAMIEGRRRLALLEHALDPSTFRRLEAIGVAPGWRCLDVGAGGGTVCEWLCRRVGATGRVTTMDLDARFLRPLEYANLHVREENVVDADFPSGAFDLVHTRWTLMHIPERERLLQKLAACLAPGGMLFLEEPDAISVRTLDRTAFLTLSSRVFEIVQPRGSDPDWARDLPFKMASLGLANMRAEAETPYFHGASELAEFWRISWGRVRDTVAESGADVAQWDRELAELDDPTRLFVSPMTIAVMATKT